ncbi:MAG: hypothetical protein Ct9H300mP13_3590 [Gammaproteobacteria bacterium]|nr:MAG: hypothetical protein Ct9H300mP13_3590 [Gammaproteobacteria bacterium]
MLGLEEGGGEGEALIRAEIEAAVREDGAEGDCAWLCGDGDLAKQISVDFGLPVIDGVAAAVKQVEGFGFPRVSRPARWGVMRCRQEKTM